jgi:hypothetical protein
MAESPLWGQLIIAAAPLPQDTLKVGLSSGRAGLVDVLPAFAATVALLPSCLADPRKTRNLLTAAVKAFRCARAKLARDAARAPGASPKSPGNISKEASIAGGFFERQLDTALLAVAVPGLLAVAADCAVLFGRVPDDVLADVLVYSELAQAGGGLEALHVTFEAEAEARAQAFKEHIVERMVGAGRHGVGVRNNAASRKSDAKRTELCYLARTQVDHVLGVRRRILDGMDVYKLELLCFSATSSATAAI